MNKPIFRAIFITPSAPGQACDDTIIEPSTSDLQGFQGLDEERYLNNQ
jgi:hypothetical protein